MNLELLTYAERLAYDNYQLWICNDCNFKTKVRQSLRNHYKTEHNKTMCRCGICSNPVDTHGNYCREPCSAGRCQCGRWG